MRRHLLSTGSLAVLLAAAPALAQPASPPPAATPAAPADSSPPPAAPPPAVAPPEVDAATTTLWQTRYVAAREDLAQGRFRKAADQLRWIAQRSPIAAMRGYAAELAALASYWDTHGLSLAAGGIRFVEAAAEPPPDARADRRTTDELALLYTGAALWGLGFGVVVGSASDGGAASYYLPGLGMAAAGVTTVALIDHAGGHPLRYGVAHSIASGLFVGAEGGLFAGILTANLSDVGASAVFAMTWGSAAAGGILGGVAGHYFGTTPGRASFLASGALWGGSIGAALTAGVIKEHEHARDSAPFVAGLAGAAVGALGAGLTAASISPSIARVRFMDLGALGGAFVAGGVYASAAAHSFNSQPFFLLASAGAAAGFGIVAATTTGMERDRPRRHEGESALRMTPVIAPVRGGATMGLGGVF